MNPTRLLLMLAGLGLGLGGPALVATAPPGQAASEPADAGTTHAAAATPTARLGAELDRVVARSTAAQGSWSILAVSLDRGDTLFARSPGQALAPASNIKIFTAAAALEYLGPDHRFATYVVADGPIRDGVLDGSLYLYGTGDPTLGTRFAQSPAPALLALADSLEALGIREIRGDIIGDGSYFTGARTGEGWQESYMNAWYAAPAGALSVHENMVRIEVEPGSDDGQPRLSFIPGGEGIAVVHDTAGSGRLRVLRTEYDGPIRLHGRLGGSASHAVSVADSEMYAAALFRDVLAERGIALHGATRAVSEPGESRITGTRVFAPAFDAAAPGLQVLAVHRSEPLLEILRVVNHRSHNFYSEQVLRTVGRVATGTGSAEGGAAAVEALMARAGVDTASVRIVDGCGLSPLNSASAGAFIAVLAYMADSPHAEALMETLPVAGEVRRFRRMGGTPAGGNLKAKTGTIEGVSALSGYVTAANGERIAFSIIGNDLRSVGAAKSLENAIGTQLAAFDRSRPVDPAGAPAVEPATSATAGGDR